MGNEPRVGCAARADLRGRHRPVRVPSRGIAAVEDRRDERFTGVDLRGARFRDCDLRDIKVTDAMLIDADISGLIQGLRVNGVEVAPLVEAELDRRHPERVQLRAAETPGAMRDAWTMIEALWSATTARARRLPEP